ncbi:MAG: hypothetical protein ABL982_14270 [Vicinamibacterales bacterium]
MSTTTLLGTPEPERRPYRPDDCLSYVDVYAEFNELTPRDMRYQMASGKIRAQRGAGNRIYFRYGDLIAFRERLIFQNSPKPKRGRRS